MNNDGYKILETRRITQEEYNLVLEILNKYKMSSELFTNNCKSLVMNKIDSDEFIINGYDSPNNTLYYNDKSDIISSLLRVASSTTSPYQGICIKPNIRYKKTANYALNEGINDLFLELGTKKEGFYPFEKICAKVIKHAYGTKLFNCYFMNDDASFRFLFNEYFEDFFYGLDEYCDKMMYARLNKMTNLVKDAMSVSIKVVMTEVITDLLKVTSDSGKDCYEYLMKQLKSKAMKPIYDIIGEYNYEDYRR